jgi:hypothetical protein
LLQHVDSKVNPKYVESTFNPLKIAHFCISPGTGLVGKR